MERIHGKKHKMGTWEIGKNGKSTKWEINKISLSCFEDKRFVLDDGIHTLAYFHKRVKRIDSHRRS